MSQWGMSQNDGGNNFAASQSPMGATPASGSKSREEETLLPVTIRMLNDAETSDDSASKVINNRKVTRVKLVGVLREIEQKSAFHNCKIEDSTGAIDVRIWANEDEQFSADVQTGNYVAVFGKCTVFNGNCQINGHAIRPVKSYNEYVHHMVNSAYIHLSQQAGGGTVAGNTAQSFDKQPGMNQQTTGQATSAGMDNADMSSWDACTKAVYSLVERLQGNSENGVHVPELMQHLSDYSEQDIRNSIVSLGNDGMVYDTVDETWIKTTSSDD